MPAGTYHVFGLKDESGQKYYTNKTELFAFADSVIVVDGNTPPVKLFAYQEEKPAQKTSSATTAEDKKLKFTSSASGGLQDLLTPLTLTFNNKLKNFDSTKVQLTDTLLNPYKSTSVSIDTSGKKIVVQNAWQENTVYKLIVPVDFAADTLGNTLTKPDTLKFKTKKES